MSKEQIKSNLKSFLQYFATPSMLVYLIYNVAVFKTETKQLQFDSSEDKVRVMQHINQAPTDVQNYIVSKNNLQLNMKLDSLSQAFKESAIERKKRDSIVDYRFIIISDNQRAILKKIE